MVLASLVEAEFMRNRTSKPLPVLPTICLLLVAFGSAQCQKEGKETVAEDRAAAQIRQFRRELADNERHPIRGKGLSIDMEAIAREAATFLKQNGGLILLQMNRSIEGLESGKAPAEPTFKRVAVFKEMDTLKAIMASAVFRPDIKSFFRTMLAAVFPTVMRNELGLTMMQVGAWVTFLSYAEPDWRVCGKEGTTVAVCAEYGGLDIFVLAMNFEKPFEFPLHEQGATRVEDGLWVPHSFAWWRRQ